MSFLSGLWVPIKFLPKILQHIAPVFPTFHLAQLMYGSLGAESLGTTASHWMGPPRFHHPHARRHMAGLPPHRTKLLVAFRN